jgi:HK97 family phage major capsid protein
MSNQQSRIDMLNRAARLVIEGKRDEATSLLDEFERTEARAETRGIMPSRSQPGAYMENGEKRAFEDYVRHGKGGVELRDMTTGGAAGALVPQAFYPVLTEAKKAWGGLLNIVNTKETDNGAPMKVAFANDTGNMAHVVGETGSDLGEVEPPLNSILSSTDMCATDYVKVTIAELQDTAFDIDKFIRDLFGKRYYRGLNNLVTVGSTSGNIESIITDTYDGPTTEGPDNITYNDIVSLYAALDPAYLETATWTMTATTRANILGVKDSLGRPLFVPSPTSGAFDRLLGLPVVLNQAMPSVGPTSPSAPHVVIQLGDFGQGYLLRSVKPGLAIVRLNERFMDTLEVGFIGYFRAGGVVTDAGTHPIVNLIQNS